MPKSLSTTVESLSQNLSNIRLLAEDSDQTSNDAAQLRNNGVKLEATFNGAYRLSTYEKFPQKASQIVSPKKLARDGFIYTGINDRVKCFSCGRLVEKFASTRACEIESYRSWHKDTCRYKIAKNTNTIVKSNSQHKQNKSVAKRPIKQKDISSIPLKQPRIQCLLSQTTVINYNNKPGVETSLVLDKNITLVHSSHVEPCSSTQETLQSEVRKFPTRLSHIKDSTHKTFIENLDLRKEADRLSTFTSWYFAEYLPAPEKYAKSGFFLSWR